MTSPMQHELYARQVALPEFGDAGQQRLLSSRVLIVGVGGLGCPVALYLALAGVGHITLVDNDTVSLSNLHRQILFYRGEVGELKVECAKRELQKRNPDITITALASRFDKSLGNTLVAEHDLIIDGSDNFATRYLINDLCVALNKPFVAGAVSQFRGQVGVFNFAGGPTYRCLFPEPPPSGMACSCNEEGVLGPVPGVVGTLQAVEALKLIALPESVQSFGSVLIFDLLANSFQRLTLARSPRSTVEAAESKLNEPSIVSLDMYKVRKLLETHGKSVQLVDVRTKEEREIENIGGVHIPLSSLPEALPFCESVIFYCASGKRSLLAAELAVKKGGYHMVCHLIGGIKSISST
jgi:sulfur-carrier protein adenylyltransferase/sulfurtransferase